jgi:hypothetical protein
MLLCFLMLRCADLLCEDDGRLPPSTLKPSVQWLAGQAPVSVLAWNGQYFFLDTERDLVDKRRVECKPPGSPLHSWPRRSASSGGG